MNILLKCEFGENMNIYKDDCEHYSVCIEDDEYAKCDDCESCEFYEKEFTIEDAIEYINNNHDELNSIFEWNNEFFSVLTKLVDFVSPVVGTSSTVV